MRFKLYKSDPLIRLYQIVFGEQDKNQRFKDRPFFFRNLLLMYDGLHKIGAHDTYLFDDWGYALELFP